MQNNISISVIIPTYNRANDLIKAINSALNQTYPVTEILVCDDGSTDNSKQLIADLHNNKVKWIECGKNGRPAIPRNIGIKHSTADWIAFLDSDDEWVSTKIEKQVAAINRNYALAVCTNASRIRFGEDKGTLSNYNNSTVTLTDLMLQNSVICSSVLLQKQLLLDISLFPEEKKFTAIEDFALWLRLATKTDFVFLNENLVRYTDNVETSVRTAYTDTWHIFEVIFSDFTQWRKQHKIIFNKIQKKEFKKLMRKIKNRGVPTPFEEFMRKLSDKLGVKTSYNS